MVPTIGRRMYFFTEHPEKFNLTSLDATQPFDAGVIFVHPDGSVNVQVTDHVGKTKTFELAEVLHDHEAGWEKPFWVEWMPYQKEQAAKQEARSLSDDSGLEARSNAWLAVTAALEEFAPNWLSLAPTAASCAVAQIQQFAFNETTNKSPAQLGAMSHSQLQEFRLELETKTSWGRNELKDLLLRVLSH